MLKYAFAEQCLSVNWVIQISFYPGFVASGRALSIHIKRWKSVLRQALINFPFYFVFNRDLVSHAIATDLNSPLFKNRSPKSGTWVKRATITNVTFETVTKLWRIESVCFRLQIFFIRDFRWLNEA